MVYDIEMEKISINWAKSCPTTKNPDKGLMGENLYWFTASSIKTTVADIDILKAIESWYNEVVISTSLVDALVNGYKTTVISHYA
jgi:hypothetical protein